MKGCGSEGESESRSLRRKQKKEEEQVKEEKVKEENNNRKRFLCSDIQPTHELKHIGIRFYKCGPRILRQIFVLDKKKIYDVKFK